MVGRPHDEITSPGFRLLMTMWAGAGVARVLAWSRDGRTIAVGTDGGSVELYDAETGVLLREITTPGPVARLAWGPDGRLLAGTFASGGPVSLWDALAGETIRLLEGPGRTVDLSWSPDGRSLATALIAEIRLWEAKTGQRLRTLAAERGDLRDVAWSPDGRSLAVTSRRHIELWDVEAGSRMRAFESQSADFQGLGWSPDARLIAVGSAGRVIRIWDVHLNRAVRVLEGHTGPVGVVAFSGDGRILASQSSDGAVQLWRCDTWEAVATLDQERAGVTQPSFALHPWGPMLATGFGEPGGLVRVWEYDPARLLGATRAAEGLHYVNAKVVLVGNSGVGKSGLALALSGQPFAPTSSTHGRHVFSFESTEVPTSDGRSECRETLLWDLAGQPGYRLVHQLHLSEVAVALVVFDSTNEFDPFAGVRYWDRALRQAHRIQGGAVQSLFKVLVAARTDRGGVHVSRERVEGLVQELGFDAFVATSAKSGAGVRELADLIRRLIDWESLPKVSSSALFQRIKAFLLEENQVGRALSTVGELFRAFLRGEGLTREGDTIRAQFETCIGLVESRSLVRRLNFGDLVLLQPEALDAYASALVNAAREEPDGMGCIAEEDARHGRFPMSSDERLPDPDQEMLLLVATIEDLLRHEIALRELSADGPYLVFPSQFTREMQAPLDTNGRTVVFRFEGPVSSIYATLAVRLAHSAVFRKREMWRNAATYEASIGGTCGIFLRDIADGAGELTIYFDSAASPETRTLFEQFVTSHLQARALPESITRLRIFECESCGDVIPDELVRARIALGRNSVFCQNCGRRIDLRGAVELQPSTPAALVAPLNQAADERRDREASVGVPRDHLAASEYDVLLCHHDEDRDQASRLAEQLKERGILAGVDGRRQIVDRSLQECLNRYRTLALLVGNDSAGPWGGGRTSAEQSSWEDVRAVIEQFIRRGRPVVPVILPTCMGTPDIPSPLSQMTWVDLRKGTEEALSGLVWALTGVRHPGSE